MQKSKKKVIPLEKIVKPYLYQAPVDENVEGSINGQRFFLSKGKLHEVPLPIFEVLLYANKINQ